MPPTAQFVPGLSGTFTPAASQTGKFHQTSRTAGNIVFNTTSYVAADTATDLAIAAVAGNKIQIGLTTGWLNEAVFGRLEVGVLVNGSPVRYLGSGTDTPATYGIAGWSGNSGVYDYPANSVWLETLASHINSDGYVRFRLYAKTDTAANKTLAGTSSSPLFFWARNHG